MSNTKKRTRIKKSAMQNIDTTVINFIAEHRNVTSQRIEKHTKASPATVSRVVRRLIQENKIERVVHKGRGRPVSFKLSEATQAARPVVQPAKRVFPTIQLMDKTRKISFAVRDEFNNEVVTINGNANDAHVITALSSVISSLK